MPRIHGDGRSELEVVVCPDVDDIIAGTSDDDGCDDCDWDDDDDDWDDDE